MNNRTILERAVMMEYVLPVVEATRQQLMKTSGMYRGEVMGEILKTTMMSAYAMCIETGVDPQEAREAIHEAVEVVIEAYHTGNAIRVDEDGPVTMN